MRFFTRCIGVMALAGLVSGCVTTGLSSRERTSGPTVYFPSLVYGAQVEDMKANQTPSSTRNLTLPMRMAVAQIGEVAPPQRLVDLLASEPALFAQVHGIPSAAETDPRSSDPEGARRSLQRQVAQMRRLASDVGAETLFFFGGDVGISETPGPLALLDLTLVGVFVIPSTRVDALAKASGVLVDVATGQVLMAVTAEEELTTRETSFERESGSQQVHLNQVRRQLIPKLAAALIARVQQQAGS